MSDVSHHIVRCYPHCMESPVFRGGGLYQVVFIRGKKKEKPPKGTLQVCQEACHLSLEQLGLFGEAVIHFKSSKGVHQKKLITYQVYCYNSPTSPGTIVGEVSIDVAALVNANVGVNACHVRKRFDFSMCSYGAFIDVTVQVCEVVRGETKPLPALIDYINGHSEGASSVNSPLVSTGAAVSNTDQGATATESSGANVKYIARDTAMAILVAMEDSDILRVFDRMTSSGDNCGSTESDLNILLSNVSGSTTLNDQMTLVSRLISLRLHSIPHRYFLQRQTVIAEAKTIVQTALQVNHGDFQAVESSLRAQLELSRARLVAARQHESVEIDEENAHIDEVVRNQGIISDHVESKYPMCIANLASRLESFTETVPRPNVLGDESASALKTEKLKPTSSSTQALKQPDTSLLSPKIKGVSTDLIASHPQVDKEQHPPNVIPDQKVNTTGSVYLPAPQPDLFSEHFIINRGTEQCSNMTNVTSININTSTFGDSEKPSGILSGSDYCSNANPFSTAVTSPQELKNQSNIFNNNSAGSSGECTTTTFGSQPAMFAEESPSFATGFEGRLSQNMFGETNNNHNTALQGYSSVGGQGRDLFGTQDTTHVDTTAPTAFLGNIFSVNTESKTDATDTFSSHTNNFEAMGNFGGERDQLFANGAPSLFGTDDHIMTERMSFGTLGQQSNTATPSTTGIGLFQ